MLRSINPAKAPATATGVTSRTEKGNDQLSYCAARIRNTHRSEIPKITIGESPSWAFFSWYDIPRYSYPMSDGMVWAKTSSSAFIAWAEEIRAAADTLIWALRKGLSRMVTRGPRPPWIEVTADSGTDSPSAFRT